MTEGAARAEIFVCLCLDDLVAVNTLAARMVFLQDQMIQRHRLSKVNGIAAWSGGAIRR